MRSLIALLLLAGCAGAGSEGPSQAPATTPAVPSTAGPGPSGDINISRDTISVGAILSDSQAYLGRHQNVRGTCLGWRGPASGPPPSTRSHWQIGDETHALWVVGPMPAGCTGASGGLTTIRAYVTADTVPLRLVSHRSGASTSSKAGREDFRW